MTQAPPRISVIIPARNEAALIAATVGSVLRARDRYREARRDGGAVEVIVVDNAIEAGARLICARNDVDGEGSSDAAAGLLLAGFEKSYLCPLWVDSAFPAN